MDENKLPWSPAGITRPAGVLLAYYFFCSLTALILFPIVLLPLYCKYVTLRYRFDEDGVAMSWGVLFRREIYLTYRRIQDIHLTRNLLQRWMGLATVAIQTASGSATPEMSIEGILAAEDLRDYLYGRMRGVREEPARDTDEGTDEVLTLLHEIRDLLRARNDR